MQKRGQKRGNNSRLRATDVRLAYLSMLDKRSEDEEVISREHEITEEEFGDWNAE